MYGQAMFVLFACGVQLRDIAGKFDAMPSQCILGQIFHHTECAETALNDVVHVSAPKFPKRAYKLRRADWVPSGPLIFSIAPYRRAGIRSVAARYRQMEN